MWLSRQVRSPLLLVSSWRWCLWQGPHLPHPRHRPLPPLLYPSHNAYLCMPGSGKFTSSSLNHLSINSSSLSTLHISSRLLLYRLLPPTYPTLSPKTAIIIIVTNMNMYNLILALIRLWLKTGVKTLNNSLFHGGITSRHSRPVWMDHRFIDWLNRIFIYQR